MASSWFLGLTIAPSLSALAAAVRVSTPSYRVFAGFFLCFPAFHFTNAMLLVGAITLAIALWLGAFGSVSGKFGIGIAIVGLAALLVVRSRSQKLGFATTRS
jgi:hypothetical protein